jgi:hypothetical protein
MRGGIQTLITNVNIMLISLLFINLLIFQFRAKENIKMTNFKTNIHNNQFKNNNNNNNNNNK